jgi:outer membrane protein assembly factor BamB
VLAAQEDSQDTSSVIDAETLMVRSDSHMILRFDKSANFNAAPAESANDRYLAEQKLTRAKKRYRFSVLSFDLESGNKLWETEVIRQLPHEPCHATNNFASASPVTDGKHIYAFFGSRGIFCLDMQGKLRWHYSQGRMQTLGSFGEGASPALFEDYLIFPWDHEGGSCLVALNAKNGYVRWKVARQERTNWATPIVVNHNGTKQIVVNGRTVRSYKLETGELIWSCPGQTEQAIPTPVVSQGRVFVTSGLRGWACFAISLDAVGPVPENSEFVHWSLKKQTPYVPSPCCYEGCLYLFNENSRTISVVKEDDGEANVPPKRLPELGEVYASPGAANGMLFVTDRSGKTLVLDAKTLELISENTLDETVDASLVFVGERILARSSNHLFCLKSE